MGMQAAPEKEPATTPEPDEAVRHEGVGEPRALSPDTEAKAAAAVEAFARDHEGLTDEDERDALDFLLAPKPPRLYGVTVQYDTEKGTLPLTFVIRGTDGRRIDAIEQLHVSETTGKVDAISAECQLVAEATVFLEGRPGHHVKLDSDEYLTVRKPKPEDEGGGFETVRLASPADAIEARFRTQLGLIAGVANHIRRISGYDPTRVGNAQRRLAAAVGNS